MRAGFASFVIAPALAAKSVAGAAADPILLDFQSATGVAGSLLGLDKSTSPGQNIGYDHFFWAWTGADGVEPGNPPTEGFLLGFRGGDFDFVSCALYPNCDLKFAYVQARPAAYITTMDQSFSFQGGVFSSTAPGTLTIVGQKTGSSVGDGAYEDVSGAMGTVTFDGQNNPGTLDISKFQEK